MDVSPDCCPRACAARSAWSAGEANPRQFEAALAIDQTTLRRSLNLLERDRMIERVPHPDGRSKAMRITRKGRRVLNVARPLQAQDKMLTWARGFGMAPSAGWPACFTSLSRTAGCG